MLASTILAGVSAQQLQGGMVWGRSMATHEASQFDRRTGQVVNADLGGYLVPVNADIYALGVHFVDEQDAAVNPLGTGREEGRRNRHRWRGRRYCQCRV